jgi:hypothetical protein
VTGSKCLSRSSLVEKSVESSDTLNGSQSDKAGTLLSSISRRGLDWNVSLARAVHSALVWNEIRRLRIAGKRPSTQEFSEDSFSLGTSHYVA